MISIFIDTQSVANNFALNESEVNQMMDYVVKEITARFASEWEAIANRNLKSSRQQYMTGIVVVDEGFAKGAVMLVGALPNMIESGASSFDMKEGFLKGPNAKQGKSGAYNTIPFSIGTPGSLAEHFSGGIMPQEVYDIVRSRPANEPIEKYDLKNLPNEMKQPQRKQVQLPESKSFTDYQHKKSIYEGISKKTDRTTGQNSYMSFRRVSENSDPSSWIHPGIEAMNLAERALDEFDIPNETGRAIDRFLAQL